jgi:hypothetical protein
MIRDAAGDDVATVVELWREFEAEAPEPAWRDDEEKIRQRELERAIGTDIVLLAEQDPRPIGLGSPTPRASVSDSCTSSTSAPTRDS